MTNSADRWDVAVVGAGPAGSLAALAAAEAGARTVLLERHRLPRYKLCGGGLIGASMASLPAGFVPPVRDAVTSALFTRDFERAAHRLAGSSFIGMVNRAEFDAALAERAVQAGAVLVEGVVVDRVEQDSDEVRLHASDGVVRAACVVGADGSASRLARHVGAEFAQVDLGLEVEVVADDTARASNRGCLTLDFGGPAGGYAWVFPKDDTLTVGAIAAKGLVDVQRAYLRGFLAAQGLDTLPVRHEGGHLTRCRTMTSPLGRGRVLLAGDAAGLLEPWTREGISFALRSGRLAGIAAASGALGAMSPEQALAGYDDAVAGSMGAEMAVGFSALRAYRRHPGVFHRVLGSTDRGWNAFVRLSRGETTLARAGRHRVVRMALDGLAL